MTMRRPNMLQGRDNDVSLTPTVITRRTTTCSAAMTTVATTTDVIKRAQPAVASHRSRQMASCWVQTSDSFVVYNHDHSFTVLLFIAAAPELHLRQLVGLEDTSTVVLPHFQKSRLGLIDA